MIRFFQQLFKSSSSQGEMSPVEEGAVRFAKWTVGKDAVCFDDLEQVDEIINQKRAADPDGEMSESLAADFASYLGELALNRFGGEWTEDPRFGFCLCKFGGLEKGRFFPLSLAEIKWESGVKFGLRTFFATLDKRLEAEEKKQVDDTGCETELFQSEKFGHEGSELFRGFWKERFGISLPLTLTGIREVDGFLRSHYIACFVSDLQLITAGLYLGEVAKGLFDGKWVSNPKEIEKTALHFPELDYYPIGRIFKMMSEHPEGDLLDEYIRLIPSARRELLKKTEPRMDTNGH